MKGCQKVDLEAMPNDVSHRTYRYDTKSSANTLAEIVSNICQISDVKLLSEIRIFDKSCEYNGRDGFIYSSGNTFVKVMLSDNLEIVTVIGDTICKLL